MRLAVISDIHGNLTALEAVINDLETAGGADHIWVLGDLAAMGPRPAECIQRVFELQEQYGKEKCEIIGGNADRYMVTGQRLKTKPAENADEFAKLAGAWQTRDTVFNWCMEQINFEQYESLKKILGRELSMHVKDYGYVIGYHAIPGDDEPVISPETPDEEALDAVLDREGRLGIGGHIHRQMDRDLGTWRLINVGSVGLSFETPGQAQWGMFTFEDGALTVNLRRVTYDVPAVIADLETVGYPAPAFFANFITTD